MTKTICEIVKNPVSSVHSCGCTTEVIKHLEISCVTFWKSAQLLMLKAKRGE